MGIDLPQGVDRVPDRIAVDAQLVAWPVWDGDAVGSDPLSVPLHGDASPVQRPVTWYLKAQPVLEWLRWVAAIKDEDCRFDHHGYCQAHNLDDPCPVQQIKDYLAYVDKEG